MKRILSIFLVLLATLALTACGNGTEASETTTVASTTSQTAATTTAISTPDAGNIVFIGGEHQYTITRPEECEESVQKAATELYNALTQKTGQKMTLATDWVKRGSEPPAHEILIGLVARDEIPALTKELPIFGYLVKVVGDKLYLLATDDEYLIQAVEHLVAMATSDGLALPVDYSYTKDVNADAYPLSNAKLGDISLNQYAISAEDAETQAMVQQLIAEYIGVRPSLATDTTTGPLLIIEQPNKRNNIKLSYMEYRIESKDGNVHIIADGTHGIGHAVKELFDRLEEAPDHSLPLTQEMLHYTLPDRETYIQDITKLELPWDYLWQAPSWMLDYDTKKKDLFGGSGSNRLWASAHRAELTFFPENSIEAVISTYYMGAAIAELDFGLTKDGVLVLMHDDTLSRTTNCHDFMGKPGYPTTAYVRDWTYAQLMELNLKEGGGGAEAKLTPFKIPTVEEALTVCKNRLFIVPDKYSNWQYVRSENIMQASKQAYLSDLMKKTGNAESIIISYGNSGTSNYLNAKDAVMLQTLLSAETGTTPMILLRTKPTEVASNYAYFAQRAVPGTFALQLNGDYKATTDYLSAYQSHGDRVTFLAWTIGTGTGWNDYKNNWAVMYKKGLRVIMTNDLFSLCQYCAEVGE